jgi:hypothetical protein
MDGVIDAQHALTRGRADNQTMYWWIKHKSKVFYTAVKNGLNGGMGNGRGV